MSVFDVELRLAPGVSASRVEPFLCDQLAIVAQSEWVLHAMPEGLALYYRPEPNWLPLRLDFIAGALGYRTAHQRGELVVRACRGKGPLADLTGGVGRDAWVLASAGRRLYLIERHPLLVTLLREALERARKRRPGVVELIQLEHGDARDWLAQQSVAGALIDPMFPQRHRGLAGRELQILQRLVPGDDREAADLLMCARRQVQKRIVVKRPRNGSLLGSSEPDNQLCGRSVRYDIYRGCG